MKKNLIKTIVIAAATSLVFTACNSDNKAIETLSQIQAREGIPVEVIQGKIKPSPLYRKYNGELKGHVQKSVYAIVPEYIKNINVSIGQKVNKGQLLASLDAAGQTPQFRQAKAQYDILKSTKERLDEVYASGGISKQKLEEVSAQYDAAAASYDAARKSIRIEAPISGVVTDIHMNQGEVTISGKDEYPFMQISDISSMIATIKVPSSDIHYFKKGVEAKIKVGQEILTGKVTKVPLAANKITRYFYVDVKFKNTKDYSLRPGVFSQVEIKVDEATGVQIPVDALVMKKKQYACYVVENNKAVLKDFNPLLIADHFVVADEKIKSGDQIIVKGLSLLKDQSKIKITSPIANSK